MQVAYVVADLTMLRYYVPFSQRLAQFFPSTEQTFFLYRGNSKYNGLSHAERYERCVKILDEFCPYARVTSDDGEFDVVFQVEVGNSLKCSRRISIQHGFDYAYRTKELKEQVDLYVCSSELTRNDAEHHGVPSIAAPIPVCMWNVDGMVRPVSPAKTALVFYPDQGDTKLAGQVVSDLEAQGFLVFVKQRRKHQPITCGGTHVFDDVWYPSEAILLPLSVDIVIGFGSSAYTDLVPMGVTYINVDIHHASRPWNAFVHPEASNYFRVLDEESVLPVIRSVAIDSKRVTDLVVDVEQLRVFMLELMDGPN